MGVSLGENEGIIELFNVFSVFTVKGDHAMKPLIDYKRLSLQECKMFQTLLRCNPLAKQAHTQLLNHIRVSKNPFKKYGFNTFRKDFFKVLPFCKTFGIPVALYGFKIPQEAVDAILAVKMIEDRLVIGHSNLVRNVANKWKNRIGHNSYSSALDLESDGYVGLLNAIYGYDRPNVKFVTYAHWAINNRIALAVNNTRSNFPWKKSLRVLYHRVEEAMSQFQGMGIDEVMEKMGLTEKQQRKVRRGLVKFIPETSLIIDPKQTKNDFTAYSTQFSRFHRVERLEVDQQIAITNANLNEWERDVLDGFISGHWGWKSEVAAKHGKSRMAPVKTLERIKTKILKNLQPKAA